MNEYFLHYVWYYGAFNPQHLTTCHGESLIVLSRGTPNGDSGPDFFNARLMIDEHQWVGNIEIHIKSSDWEKHKHHQDPAYNNTILHVVFEHDRAAYTQSGSLVPVFELKNRIPVIQLQKFKALHENLEQVPCRAHNPSQHQIELATQLHKALVQRMAGKSERILQLARELNYDWHSVFYITLARHLGFRINTEAMEILARNTPHKILARNRDKPLKMEALLFGQAGMLEQEIDDPYFMSLKKEYLFQKKKYNLTPMLPVTWKFARLRPANFPTLRIAQLAQIAIQNEHLFSLMLHENETSKMLAYFDITASEYWSTHFRFGFESGYSLKKLGIAGKEGLIMNAVAPCLFAYGQHQHNDELKEKALSLLDQLSPENNRILSLYKSLNIKADTGYLSQAILGLYHDFCSKKKCLDCNVGIKILRSG